MFADTEFCCWHFYFFIFIFCRASRCACIPSLSHCMCQRRLFTSENLREYLVAIIHMPNYIPRIISLKTETALTNCSALQTRWEFVITVQSALFPVEETECQYIIPFHLGIFHQLIGPSNSGILHLFNVWILHTLVLHRQVKFNTSVKCSMRVCNQSNLFKKNNSSHKLFKGGYVGDFISINHLEKLV